MKSKFLKILLFFLAGFTVLYFVFSSQNKAFKAECALKGISENDCSLSDKLIHDFTSANLFLIGVSVFFFMLSNVFRALRWDMLLKPLGTQPKLINSVGAIMMAYLANLAIPRAGEFVRAGVISKYENITFEKSFGTIVTDRVVDVICLLMVFLLTLVFASNTIFQYFDKHFSLSQRFGFITQSPILSMLLILGGLACFYLLWKKKDYFTQSTIGLKINNMISGIIEGFTSILKLDNVPLFLLYSVAIWTLYYLMTYIVFKAFFPTEHLGMVAGLVVFLFGSLGIVFPSPGGMGSYHFLVISALAIYGINGADAFSFANIVFFSIQIFGNIFFGGLSMIFLPIYNKANVKA